MTLLRFVALAFVATGAIARADPGDFRVVIEGARAPYSEESALHGFILLNETATGARAVGAVGRAYSVSPGPDNTVWGMVSEAANFPGAQGNIVGIESAVVNMAPGNVGELRGIDIMFKNRLDVNVDVAVPVVGANGYNERSAGIYIGSQPRSPAGEYSGWQSGIRFGKTSLDRSASVPYTAAIDVSEVETIVPFYVIVWRCGAVKCGLKPTDQGFSIVLDIEHEPAR